MILNVKKANSIGWGFIAGNRSGMCFLKGEPNLERCTLSRTWTGNLELSSMLVEITMTHGKPKPGSFSGRFGGEERILQLWQIVFGNTATIVPDFQKSLSDPFLKNKLDFWIRHSAESITGIVQQVMKHMFHLPSVGPDSHWRSVQLFTESNFLLLKGPPARINTVWTTVLRSRIVILFLMGSLPNWSICFTISLMRFN